MNFLNKFPDKNPNPVMRLSKQGLVLYRNVASQALLECWGYLKNDQINGKAFEVLQQVIASNSSRTEEFRCREHYFTVIFMPIMDSNFINVYGMDTTVKKHAEIALRDALTEVRKLRNRLHRENRYLREEIRDEIGYHTMIGDSDVQQKLMHNIDQVADTDTTVLITGETGTGKELIARAIHQRSRRGSLPLIKINCAALPTELFESELFGHQKGAFTGALFNKEGRFELADGGTLFLDEIGDIPVESQSKLLRALQEQEFERVGGNKTIKVDVRVIAATNRDLANNIASGKFRADLFYRLNVFPIHSLPLRERRDDIEILACHFLRKYRRKIGRAVDIIEPTVIERLRDYYWPGNVRELENIIERAVILTEGRCLQLDDAFDLNAPPLTSHLKTLGEVEQEMIQTALEDCGWKIEGDQGAATRLALAPSTLRERIKKYGLARNRDESSMAAVRR